MQTHSAVAARGDCLQIVTRPEVVKMAERNVPQSVLHSSSCIMIVFAGYSYYSGILEGCNYTQTQCQW